MMVEQLECLWTLISILVHLFHVLKKGFAMAICSSSSAPPPSPLSWKRLAESPVLVSKKARRKEEALSYVSEGKVAEKDGIFKRDVSRAGRKEETLSYVAEGKVAEKDGIFSRDVSWAGRKEEPLISYVSEVKVVEKDGIFSRDVSRAGRKEGTLSYVSEKDGIFNRDELNECLLANAAPFAARKLWKRPARILIPGNGGEGAGGCGFGFGEGVFRVDEEVGREVEVEGSGYFLASRRGARHMMEDGYGVMTNIHGDSKQAFFGVFDGHGGRSAVDFVSEKLGKNILSAVQEMKEEEDQHNVLEMAIKTGYLATDREFLGKGLCSGACAATVFLKNGELHVSNVGDCRVVMSRKGIADVLTADHRPGREDERIRIENLGGYVNCNNGVWRVQDSLAISRAIGDMNMKEWIISEPETKRLPLTQDCDFLIVASDGLWDKVSNQEAVDVVVRQRTSMKCCKDLVEISCSRGNRDDITVMVVDLQSFCLVG